MVGMMGSKTTLSLRLSSTFYVFGCKKYIFKKCDMNNRFGFTVGKYNAWKGFVSVNFSYLLEGDIITYGPDAL